MYPLVAARSRVSAVSHGAPCSRAHLSISMLVGNTKNSTAYMHVSSQTPVVIIITHRHQQLVLSMQRLVILLQRSHGMRSSIPRFISPLMPPPPMSNQFVSHSLRFTPLYFSSQAAAANVKAVCLPFTVSSTFHMHLQ